MAFVLDDFFSFDFFKDWAGIFCILAFFGVVLSQQASPARAAEYLFQSGIRIIEGPRSSFVEHFQIWLITTQCCYWDGSRFSMWMRALTIPHANQPIFYIFNCLTFDESGVRSSQQFESVIFLLIPFFGIVELYCPDPLSYGSLVSVHYIERISWLLRQNELTQWE